jgi:hypothetical protein
MILSDVFFDVFSDAVPVVSEPSGAMFTKSSSPTGFAVNRSGEQTAVVVIAIIRHIDKGGAAIGIGESRHFRDQGIGILYIHPELPTRRHSIAASAGLCRSTDSARSGS